MKYLRAQDTFVAELDDGTTARVVKGDVLPESHELVRRDQAATGALFAPLDGGEDEAPPKVKRASVAKVQA